MKTIKALTVTVTYRAELEDIQVSDEIYNQLYAMHGLWRQSRLDSDCTKAGEWLSEHINESDGCDWEFEIDNLYVEE
jgi:hypothetical protein